MFNKIVWKRIYLNFHNYVFKDEYLRMWAWLGSIDHRSEVRLHLEFGKVW